MGPRREGHDAVDAFVVAAQSLGLDARLAEGDSGADAVLVLPGGEALAVRATATSLVTADTAAGQLRRWSTEPGTDAVRLVIADRVTAGGRDQLNQGGWSWLDLRGHLKMTGPGLFVDADVPALAKPRPARQGLTGQVGIELAALLLLDPTRRIGVRAAAVELTRSPSSISGAFAAMHAAGLVDTNRAPAVPELFWELAEHWKPLGEDVASIPTEDRGRDNSVLHLGLDDAESTTGWALSDTVAAARYGAPVSMRADHPRDFYVPDQSTLRRAVRLLGHAATPAERGGRVRVAPVPLVCTRRIDGTLRDIDEHWPLANPLFAALDLAQDPGRGREILALWTPREPWHRVW
jgi:hypothetical protein